jgi:hypothetical protein
MAEVMQKTWKLNSSHCTATAKRLCTNPTKVGLEPYGFVIDEHGIAQVRTPAVSILIVGLLESIVTATSTNCCSYTFNYDYNTVHALNLHCHILTVVNPCTRLIRPIKMTK